MGWLDGAGTGRTVPNMTRVPDDFLDRVTTVVTKARRHDLTSLNEANTKALLIEPILAALGWDVADLDSVTREYKVYDGTYLDYALIVEAKAVLFCEAKPTGKRLEDPKWVSQTINYANNEGVVWCVLTDGLRWRVFKANEAVTMAKKLAFEVTLEELTDPERRDNALRLFAHLTPAAVAEGDLSALGTQIFVDGRVREALSQLVDEPTKKFLDAIRAAIGPDISLSPAEVRAALARASDDVTAALSNSAPSVPASPAVRSFDTADTAQPEPGSAAQRPAAERGRGREATYEERLAKWPVADLIDATLRHDLDTAGFEVRERKLYRTIHRGGVLLGGVEAQRNCVKLRLKAGIPTLEALVPEAAGRLTDISKVGHWAPGVSSFDLTIDTLPVATKLLAAVAEHQT